MNIAAGTYFLVWAYPTKAEGRSLSKCMPEIQMDCELGTLLITWQYSLHAKYLMLR